MYFIYVLKNIKTSNNIFNYLQIQSGVGDKINRILFLFFFGVGDKINRIRYLTILIKQNNVK
jgi:hypothetical protein